MKNIFLAPRKERAFYQKVIALFLTVSMNLSVGGLGVLLLPSVAYAIAPTELITNGGFELSPPSTGWSVGAKWNINSSRKHGGDQSVEVKGSTTPLSLLSQSPISTLGYSNIHGRFWYHADGGISHSSGQPTDGSLENNDYVKAEYTLNGTTWTTFFTINDENDAGEWHQVDFDFPAGAGNNSQFGIHFLANLNSSSGDQVNIDDISVTGIDTTAPDTTITAGPAEGSTIYSSSTALSFTSTESPSTFQCKLDLGSYASCTSPKSYTSLSDGSHTFSVKAKDAAGNEDATPATRTWTVSTHENTLELCSDGSDNDGDQLIDLADSDCVQFKPQITVEKIVDGGQNPASFFDIFVNLLGGEQNPIATLHDGDTIAVNPGSYSIAEGSYPPL